jgi:hypothetical protein
MSGERFKTSAGRTVGPDAGSEWSVSAHLRRWLVVVVLLAVAGCGATRPSTRQARTGAAPTLPAPLRQVTFDRAPWRTDFARHSVPLTSILPGGPPPDGIPPIDHPRYVSIAQAARFLAPSEPVIAVQLGGQARAYPLQILIWHEIVNDTLGGVPIAVTYCPLCNSAIVFDRWVVGRTLTFGTTGNLRDSDLVMWDRQTQSWWQQFSGQAMVGTLTGTQLKSARLGDAQLRRLPHPLPAGRRALARHRIPAPIRAEPVRGL